MHKTQKTLKRNNKNKNEKSEVIKEWIVFMFLFIGSDFNVSFLDKVLLFDIREFDGSTAT